MTSRRPRLLVVAAVGIAQILAWGSSYYLPAVLAAPEATATGWGETWIIGALSLGLLVSGLVSPQVGHLIERFGGRPVLTTPACVVRVTVEPDGSRLPGRNFIGELADDEKGPLRTQEVEGLVGEGRQLVKPMGRMKDRAVEQSGGDPPRVQCDPFAVRQLLLNVLLNALDFTRTRIVIRTARAPDGSADVWISDDGPGVPPENRERIFRRFVTTRPGGNGLGLSTSREIAESHGGSLTLEDTHGGGATFVLRLPAVTVAAAAVSAP